MKFNSSYFKNRYAFNPTDYDLKFMHFYLDEGISNKEEIDLIDEDLLNFKNYVGSNCFKLYFNDVNIFNNFKDFTNVFEQLKDNIYLRIRNKQELDKLNTSQINLIIEKDDLNNITVPLNNKIIIQIDDIRELSLEEIEKYPINNILVGQICYMGWEYNQDILNVADKYNIAHDDYLNIEKNVLISNDIYSIQEYKDIYNKILLMIQDIDINDSEINKFLNVYKKIINNIQYDHDGVVNNKLENQTLLGGLLKGICVCEGYCKILKQVLSLLNIESVVVGGNGLKEEGGHLWNQVKIDGIWYNVDATYDSYLIHQNKEMIKCLVSDQEVYKTTYPAAHKCPNNYNWNKKIK